MKEVKKTDGTISTYEGVYEVSRITPKGGGYTVEVVGYETRTATTLTEAIDVRDVMLYHYGGVKAPS